MIKKLKEEEYHRYLERLLHLIYIELVVKVAMLDYFSEHAHRYGDDPVEVEPLLWPIISGLHYDVTFSLHRLVFSGNGDRSIIHFLNVTRNDFNRIVWKKPFPKSKVNEFLNEWKAKSDQIDRLTVRRNKFFAHYDKEYFYEPDMSLKKIPFSLDDAKELTRLLQRTVSFFNGALIGAHPISMEGLVYAGAERMYETLRDANKEAAKRRT